MSHTPKLPSYGMSFTEFCGLPTWLGEELHELLEEDRDATIDALKGKKPLSQVAHLPRKRVGAIDFE